MRLPEGLPSKEAVEAGMHADDWYETACAIEEIDVIPLLERIAELRKGPSALAWEEIEQHCRELTAERDRLEEQVRLCNIDQINTKAELAEARKYLSQSWFISEHLRFAVKEFLAGAKKEKAKIE
jgi:hypothetical protein